MDNVINPALASVVIPVYNSAEFVEEAVESALNQTYSNLEVLIVDDGSTDQSLERLNKYVRDKRVKLFKSENYGAASARNLGILMANGEYLAFLDSDDVWLANKLEKQINVMEEENFDYITSTGYTIFLSRQRNQSYDTSHEIVGDYCEDTIRDDFQEKVAFNPLLPTGLIVRRSRLHFVGIFDPFLTGPAEDYDFHRRVVAKLRGKHLKEPLFFYRVLQGSASRRSLLRYYWDNRRALQKKNIEEKSTFLRRSSLHFKLQYMFLKTLILRLSRNKKYFMKDLN